MPATKRHLRIGLLVLALSPAGVPVASAASPQCGDLDGNGSIVSSDALRLLRLAVGQQVAVECPAGLNCWDTNTNGTCDPAEDRDGDETCGPGDCRGEPGPVSLSALEGSACKRGEDDGVLRVATDPQTGIVTMTCTIDCPCFDSDDLKDVSAEWNHCESPLFPGQCDTFCAYSLCSEQAWDGDDNCNLGVEASVAVFFQEFSAPGAYSCSRSTSGSSLEQSITRKQAEVCAALIEEVVSEKALCCDWNNNQPLCF